MITQADDLRRRDLLLAIFADESASLMAWERWQRYADLDALSRAEFGLLPALVRRLESHGVAHPWLTRLRGVQRYCWTANQVTRRDVVMVFSALAHAGVDAAAPGGLPLITRAYNDLAGRLADHVDVLVLPEAIGTAHATLVSLGWSPRTPLPRAELRSVCGPITYQRDGHRHVLLHWHCAPAPVSDSTNRTIFSRRMRVTFGADSVEMLDDADLLVLTCVHHRRFARDDTLMWVADAVLLLRQLDVTSRQSLGWERANALGVGRRFAGCIAEIRALVGDVLSFIPPEPSSPAGDEQRSVGIMLDSPPHSADMRRAWSRARLRYDAWSTSVGAPRSLGGFIRFSVSLYRHDWNVPLWRLPLTLLQRLYGHRLADTKADGQLTPMSNAWRSVSA